MTDRKTHWENVYRAKQPAELSWTQQVPQTSLDLISSVKVSKSASIIDVGGGDSRMVDYLLDEGFEDITVLDIAEAALNRAKQRLGAKAEKVKWVVADITEFEPVQSYHIWHDRATFHFLTTSSQIEKYVAITRKAVTGYLIIGTFSDKGPNRCSGLDVKRYNEQQLEHQFAEGFQKISCIEEDHTTPFDTTQNFLFCCFRRE